MTIMPPKKIVTSINKKNISLADGWMDGWILKPRPRL